MRASHLLAVSALLAALSSPLRAQSQDSAFAVSRGGQSLFRVNTNGNVGVGVSNPSQRLTVDGGVMADSATVQSLRVSGGVQADSVSVSRVRFPDGGEITS